VKCAIELSKKKTEHKKKLADKVEIEVLKLKVKTISDYTKEAQAVFNKWIRTRDINEPCISCGKEIKGVKHASHYLSAGLHSSVRFHELNVHKSCYKCNVMLSGNSVEYRKRLVERIGLDMVEEIEKQGVKPKKWTVEELLKIKKEYAIK
jgi:hypothetical protein